MRSDEIRWALSFCGKESKLSLHFKNLARLFVGTIFKQQTQHFQMSVASCQMRCSVICVECGLVGFHSCLEPSWTEDQSGWIWFGTGFPDIAWERLTWKKNKKGGLKTEESYTNLIKQSLCSKSLLKACRRIRRASTWPLCAAICKGVAPRPCQTETNFSWKYAASANAPCKITNCFNFMGNSLRWAHQHSATVVAVVFDGKPAGWPFSTAIRHSWTGFFLVHWRRFQRRQPASNRSVWLGTWQTSDKCLTSDKCSLYWQLVTNFQLFWQCFKRL